MAKARVFFHKAAFVVLVLCATVVLQTASLAGNHAHDHAKERAHSCEICHIGHLPLTQAASYFRFAPPVAVVWLFHAEELDSSGESLFAFKPSRAPPAIFAVAL